MRIQRLPVFILCAAAICPGQKAAPRITPLPDGSGSLKLPRGWRITGAINGMVSAEGPEGSVDLGINAPVSTPEFAASIPLGPPTVAVYGNPAADAQMMLGMAWKIAPQSIRIVGQASVAWWTTGPGETIHLVAASAGHECLLTVLTGATGPGQFMYYQSGVCAAPDKFAANLPVLLRIWASWKVSDAVCQARLRDAACSLKEINQIIRRVARRRQDAFDDANAAWDEIIRGW